MPTLPSEIRSEMQAVVRQQQVKGFRDATKAPLSALVPLLARAFTHRSDVVQRIMRAWLCSQTSLYRDLRAHLADKPVSVLLPQDVLPFFIGYCREPETNQLLQAFFLSHPTLSTGRCLAHALLHHRAVCLRKAAPERCEEGEFDEEFEDDESDDATSTESLDQTSGDEDRESGRRDGSGSVRRR